MVTYLIGNVEVDPNGNPVATEPASPFASLTPAVQTALEKAGITSVAQAKELGAEGLEALDGVGEKSAAAILAL